MENFTPVGALIGGVLIGSAAVLLLLLNGRIAGIAGILNGSFGVPVKDAAWRLAFLAGLIGGGAAYWYLAPQAFVPRSGFPLGWLLLAGFLVGAGTRLGSGCTSGHGVCGVGRRSLRSLVATATFVATGMVTTYVMRHVLGVGA